MSWEPESENSQPPPRGYFNGKWKNYSASYTNRSAVAVMCEMRFIMILDWLEELLE